MCPFDAPLSLDPLAFIHLVSESGGSGGAEKGEAGGKAERSADTSFAETEPLRPLIRLQVGLPPLSSLL